MLLGQYADKRAIKPLEQIVAGDDTRGRIYAMRSIGQLLAADGPAYYHRFLADEDREMREMAVARLARLRPESDIRLLSTNCDVPVHDFDNIRRTWLDPREPLTKVRVRLVANQLGLLREAVRSRYEAMATEFGLILAWRS